eukprot:14248685-Alexandrium_andersonii.AAC.1
MSLLRTEEKPLEIETSRKASSERKWSRTCGQAFGCRSAMSSRRLSSYSSVGTSTSVIRSIAPGCSTL